MPTSDGLGEPVLGVLLQSPLMSAYRVGFHFRFSLWGDRFCNCDRVGSIRSPVFIIHGTHDEIVPFWHGQELYLAVEERFKCVLPFRVSSRGIFD